MKSEKNQTNVHICISIKKGEEERDWTEIIYYYIILSASRLNKEINLERVKYTNKKIIFSSFCHPSNVYGTVSQWGEEEEKQTTNTLSKYVSETISMCCKYSMFQLQCEKTFHTQPHARYDWGEGATKRYSEKKCTLLTSRKPKAISSYKSYK